MEPDRIQALSDRKLVIGNCLGLCWRVLQLFSPTTVEKTVENTDAARL
jgi:hypothetical protein